MEQAFEDSKEYEDLEKQNLLEDYDAYEKAFEKFKESYESWPVMRRRMANKKLA